MDLMLPPLPQSPVCREHIISLIEFIDQVSKKFEALPTAQMQCRMPGEKCRDSETPQPVPWQIDGETVSDLIFGDSKITADDECSHEIKRHLLLGRKARQHIKKQKHYFTNKGLSSQSYGFFSSHIWM